MVARRRVSALRSRQEGCPGPCSPVEQSYNLRSNPGPLSSLVRDISPLSALCLLVYMNT